MYSATLEALRLCIYLVILSSVLLSSLCSPAKTVSKEDRNVRGNVALYTPTSDIYIDI